MRQLEESQALPTKSVQVIYFYEMILYLILHVHKYLS